MKFIMIDAFKGASGKICGHSDMGTTYNVRTGKTYSRKTCNPRDTQSFPYSDKELATQSAFKARTIAVSRVVKALTDDQRKALLRVRNERRLFSFRQLIEGIYDKETQTVPADKLAELIALGNGSDTTLNDNGGVPSGGGGDIGF